MSRHTKTLIAGATGQIGSSVGSHLIQSGDDWNPIGLARRPPPSAAFPMIAVDLTDSADCKLRLGGLEDVTHIVYAARFTHFGGAPESVETNVAMLANLIDAVEPVAHGLKHVHLVHGTKYYGHTVRERAVPYREEDACGNPGSFYLPQQRLLEQRQQGRDWTWSVSRPHAFCNHRDDEPRNMILVVAIYATLLRELGLPLIFPGTARSFDALTQFSWLPTLSRAIAWMMRTPKCANQAYNVVNGDPMRWRDLWPTLAAYFGMKPGGPDGSSFAGFVADKAPLWNAIVKRHNLRPTDLHTIAQWPYGDYVLSVQWDVVSDMSKAARDGFTERVDSRRMWIDGFDYFRRQRIIA
jgi:nucleoside-diphosphate-sugar epimerase